LITARVARLASTFADEVNQMGYQDRVKLTQKLFGAATPQAT